MSTVETATEIRPFNLEITEKQIDDLRRRIAATRWPSQPLAPRGVDSSPSFACLKLKKVRVAVIE
jgi:hypothetical protein